MLEGLSSHVAHMKHRTHPPYSSRTSGEEKQAVKVKILGSVLHGSVRVRLYKSLEDAAMQYLTSFISKLKSKQFYLSADQCGKGCFP